MLSESLCLFEILLSVLRSPSDTRKSNHTIILKYWLIRFSRNSRILLTSSSPLKSPPYT